MNTLFSHPKTTLSVIIVIILVTYAVFSIQKMRQYIQIGKGLAASAIAYEQRPGAPTSRILVLGDSSAVGVGATRPEDSVAGRIGAAHPSAEITNIAVSGAKVEGLKEQLANTKIQNKYFDVTYLHIGGNDIVRFTSLAKLQQALPAALEDILKISDRIVLLHGGNVGSAHLFPWPARQLYTIRTKQVRELWMSAAAASSKVDGRSRVIYVDMFRSGNSDPFVKDAGTFYSADHFHPGSEGYRDWYNLITAAEKENGIVIK